MKGRSAAESVIHGFRRRLKGVHLFARHSPMIAVSFLIVSLMASTTHAQNLNWEGQTGAFVTPFAYTSASPADGVGLPAIAFHYLNGGDVIGGLYQVSATVGFLSRFEVGYTRAFNSAGSTAGLSPLFGGGFNIVHGKANLVPENAGKQNYLPALSVGFVARSQVRRGGGVLTDKKTTSGDVYLVATKTITQTKAVPIVLNFGVKATNASVLAIAGNAPDWKGRLFGTIGFVLPGPAGTKLVVGSEALQQPRYIKDLAGATLPTTLDAFVRVLLPAKTRLNIDFGVARAAGQILPGVDIHAESQFATGISYRF
jgi:hypothetical protein